MFENILAILPIFLAFVAIISAIFATACTLVFFYEAREVKREHSEWCRENNVDQWNLEARLDKYGRI